jgi:hypothetical protein
MNFRRTKTKALPIRGEPARRQSAGQKNREPDGSLSETTE